MFEYAKARVCQTSASPPRPDSEAPLAPGWVRYLWPTCRTIGRAERRRGRADERPFATAWQKPFDPRGSNDQFPRIVAPYKKYITVGNALASRERWKLAGRWTAKPGEPGAGTRDINVHTVGNKRELIPDESCWPDYVSTSDWEARRCRELIRTIPALNNDTALSRPRMPKWLDKDIGRDVEDQEEQEEIAAGFE
jgi:hypothetical protein